MSAFWESQIDTTPGTLTEWTIVRAVVMSRAYQRCEVGLPGCEQHAIAVHHRKLRSHGVDNSLVNLLAVCLHCHTEIHAHPEKSYNMGHMVKSWQDPNDVAIVTFNQGASRDV